MAGIPTSIEPPLAIPATSRSQNSNSQNKPLRLIWHDRCFPTGVSRDNPRSTVSVVASLIGECLREIAVLIAVFAPLDLFTRVTQLTAAFVLVTIVGVLLLLGIGVLLEVKRP